MSGPTPVCKAFILSLSYSRNDQTGLVSVHDIIFRLPRINGQTPPFACYAQLVGGQGRCEVSIAIHDSNDRPAVAPEGGGEMPITFRNKFDTQGVGFSVPQLELPSAGIYFVLLIADGREVGRQRIEVRDHTPTT